MKKIFLVFIAVCMAVSAAKADIIILKDEQKFEGDIKSFDSYYLVVEFKGNKKVSIPWNEVRYIKHTTTASSWLEEAYMNNESVEVTTLVTPLEPENATMKAFFPGLIVHGSGHAYARDNNTSLSLLSAEIVSVIIIAISVNELLNPEDVNVENTGDTVTRAVFFTGLGIFTGSWLYDILFAGSATERFNNSSEFILGKEKSEDSDRK